MKKIFITLSILATTFGFSQENSQSAFPKNEIKANALFLVAGALEVTYERIINEESGAGISAFVSYDDDIETNFSLTTYYRYYFGKKPAAGFFVEGFGMLNSYTQPANEDGLDWFSNYEGPEKDITDFALGFGLGSKWITKKGFIFEINAGIGRNLFNSSDTDFETVGRGGITLGYRF